MCHWFSRHLRRTNQRQAPAWGADFPSLQKFPTRAAPSCGPKTDRTCQPPAVAFLEAGRLFHNLIQLPQFNSVVCASTKPSVSSKPAPPLRGELLLGKINKQALSHDKQVSALSREPMCGFWGATALGSHFHVASQEALGMVPSWSPLSKVQRVPVLLTESGRPRGLVSWGQMAEGKERATSWGEACAAPAPIPGKKAGAPLE